MYVNHSKGIRGCSIANIVLGCLGIIGILFVLFSVGIVNNELAGYGNQIYMEGSYYSTRELQAMLGTVNIWLGISLVCVALLLVAGIIGVRNAASPEKMGLVMVWGIIGAIAGVCGAGIIGGVLSVIVAVFASKDKKGYQLGYYASLDNATYVVPGAQVMQPMVQPVVQPGEQAMVSQPGVQPMAQPAVQPMVQPDAQLQTQTFDTTGYQQPATQPTYQPQEGFVVMPPEQQPAVQPMGQPTTQPMQQPAPQQPQANQFMEPNLFSAPSNGAGDPSNPNNPSNGQN